MPLIISRPFFNPVPIYAPLTTWNSGDKTSNVTLSNGDLTMSFVSSGDGQEQYNVRSIFNAATGKVYVELTLDSLGAAGDIWIGFSDIVETINTKAFQHNGLMLRGSGLVWDNGTSLGHSGFNYAQGDVAQLAADFDTGNGWYGRNGTYGGIYPLNRLADGASYAIFCGSDGSPNDMQTTLNSGQSPYQYGPPSGF